MTPTERKSITHDGLQMQSKRLAALGNMERRSSERQTRSGETASDIAGSVETVLAKMDTIAPCQNMRKLCLVNHMSRPNKNFDRPNGTSTATNFRTTPVSRRRTGKYSAAVTARGAATAENATNYGGAASGTWEGNLGTRTTNDSTDAHS